MTLWGYLPHAAISRCGGPAAGRWGPETAQGTAAPAGVTRGAADGAEGKVRRGAGAGTFSVLPETLC